MGWSDGMIETIMSGLRFHVVVIKEKKTMQAIETSNPPGESRLIWKL